MKKIKKSTLSRILTLVKKRRWWLIGTLICAALYVTASIMIPVFVGEAVDLAVGYRNVDFSGIARILVKIAVFTALAGVAQYLMNLFNNRISYGTVTDLRRAAFDKTD